MDTLLTPENLDQILKAVEAFQKEKGWLPMAWVYGPEDSYLAHSKFTRLCGKNLTREGGRLYNGEPSLTLREQLEELIEQHPGKVIAVNLYQEREFCLSWSTAETENPQQQELANQVQPTHYNPGQLEKELKLDSNPFAQKPLPPATPAWDPREQSNDFDPNEFR